MPEPLKNIYSEKLVKSVAKEFKKEFIQFKKSAFIKTVLNNGWDDFELKDRMRHIATCLGDFLPEKYEQAIEIVLSVADNYSGMEHMFFPEFVERFGLHHFTTSMQALEHLTINSSSEFAIRPFIIHYPERAMKQMEKWSRSKNEHVRRLASEGCRPRLPWAMALPDFKNDPTILLGIIKRLRNDESLYVRRSVANNLNDISKDNPDVVIAFAQNYLGQSNEVNWVIKHACRGLLKQGNKSVLPLFGFGGTKHVQIKQFKVNKVVKLGDKLDFCFELHSKQKQLGKLRLEFMIEFMKANGKHSGKIFKIAEGEYSEKSKKMTKYFSFKPITTRRYYPGKHIISIVINGNKFVNHSFELIQ